VTVEIEQLATMSESEVREFFRTSDVLEITTIVRDATDEQLTRLIEIDHLRSEAVGAILARFPEFADAGRLGEIEGVVRFDLVHRKKKHAERHTVRFTAGSVALEPDVEPEVTISAELLDFVRLVTGQSNAALLYLGGRLGIDGHAMLALAVGSVFTVPGSGVAAVDPTSLDPVEVATAVATTSVKHMRSVMEGDFRPIVLEEVFRRFPEFIDTGKAEGLELTIGFRIGGRLDGEVDRYVVHVRDGACAVETDPPEGQRRDATVIIDGADFLRLALGQMHPVRGVLTGSMKVKGDRAKALALNAVMVPPQPRQ
jgi:putative sterol carrier protein